LIIRVQQMEVFQEAAYDTFAGQLAKALRQIQPQDVTHVSDAELLQFVRAAVERGRSFGLLSELSLSPFVATSVRVAPNFYEHPNVNSILVNYSIPEDRRMELLLETTSADTWQQVLDTADDALWCDDEDVADA
jgi:hypothetical protein